MPYIITTTREVRCEYCDGDGEGDHGPCPDCSGDETIELTTCLAAVALPGAKGVAWSAVEDAADGDDLGVEDQAITDLPPEGGTITLANGARVEVELVRWSAINPDMDGDPMGPEDAAIEVETYNARQVA
jgi:hypothetical protein